jgi:phenylalanyl-tRNA synthetase beta chain
VAIAGVMGGADTEIGFSTHNILIEAAWFDPISVRRTSKALGLRTEASYRFERGADPEIAELASRRAAELIQQVVAGGEILAGVVDVYPHREPPPKIQISRSDLLRVMGADVPDRDIEEILGALGFHPARIDANRGNTNAADAVWQCAQPSWRRDVARGIDLIEEIVRHYGYDKFPPRLPPAKQPAQRLPHAAELDRLRERVIALGYQEIVEIPLVDARRDELFRPEGTMPAIIGNPLAEDASVMRSTGIVSMISALEWNLNHGQRNLRLFEIGRTYELRDGEPVETPVLTFGATGLARSKTVHGDAREWSLADLKGDMDLVGELAGGFTWKAEGPAWLAAGRASQIALARPSAEPLGVAGQLSRRIADQLKLRQNVFVAELRLEPLLGGMDAARAALRFTPIPRFPAVERDFSLVLADGTTLAQVVAAIRALGIPELQRIEAADLFRGGQVPPGKFSLMIRVAFQSAEATLTDIQSADFSSRIVAALEARLGATLRA